MNTNTNAYAALQKIITTLDEVRAVLNAAADYSTDDTEKTKADLLPLIMAAGDLLEKAITVVDDLETGLELPESEGGEPTED